VTEPVQRWLDTDFVARESTEKAPSACLR